jgi:pheromone shutdown-related protein TraB
MQSNPQDNMIHHLSLADKKVTLIGTAHVSKESVKLVKSVISTEKPDTVCVELCQSRYQAFKQRTSWRETDIVKVIKEKKAFVLLSNLILASFQRRIAEKLDIRPGQEMLQAIESAKEIEADVHLADRDIRITLSRTWRVMGFWSKIKLIFQLILSFGEIEEINQDDIEKLKQQDVLDTVISEVGKSHPEIRKTLIDERDQYLAQKIGKASGNNIVAVVGAGHVPGIKEYWGTGIDLKGLEELPPKKKGFGIFSKWILPIFIILLICYGFFAGGVDSGADMVTMWILANGVLAGIGALAALAHPFTILASILAAPLTSINPMIAAGWVSGLVEAFSRKPKVRDFENLPWDILSAKGFWRNKVTRILLVVVFTNLGSTIGTFVAIPLMVKII